MPRDQDDMKMPVQSASDFRTTLAHHDAQITNLGGRISGVESGLRTLQGEVHTGFANVTQNVTQQINSVAAVVNALSSKFDRMDAAPKFDFHRIVGTIVSLAALFAMICAGIIYITTAQTSAVIAEQKAYNNQISHRVETNEDAIRRLAGWAPVVETEGQAKASRRR